MFATQRPLTLEELTRVLEPLGTPIATEMFTGGTFCAVQQVDLEDGRSVVAKVSVPDTAEQPPLLTYERDLLATERDMLTLLADIPGVPSAPVLLEDFTREHVEVDVLVTQLLPGELFNEASQHMSKTAIANAYRQMGAIFAAMHRIEGPMFGFPANGFALGAPDWPTAFTVISESVLADATTWDVDVRADDIREAVTRGHDALAEVQRPTLLHMDMWPGNVLLDPATGNIQGVIDFERALYSDPIAEFVGSESMTTGPTNPDMYAGYLDAGGTLPLDPHAGTVTGLTRAADYRTTLYRLHLKALQLVEMIPRKFTGDWAVAHKAQLIEERDVLLDRVAIGY